MARGENPKVFCFLYGDMCEKSEKKKKVKKNTISDFVWRVVRTQKRPLMGPADFVWRVVRTQKRPLMGPVAL